MISYIMAIFGYVKVPKEAIYLSLLQEGYFELWIRTIKDKDLPDLKKELNLRLLGQKTITKFLRSGRLLNDKEM